MASSSWGSLVTSATPPSTATTMTLAPASISPPSSLPTSEAVIRVWVPPTSSTIMPLCCSETGSVTRAMAPSRALSGGFAGDFGAADQGEHNAVQQPRRDAHRGSDAQSGAGFRVGPAVDQQTGQPEKSEDECEWAEPGERFGSSAASGRVAAAAAENGPDQQRGAHGDGGDEQPCHTSDLTANLIDIPGQKAPPADPVLALVRDVPSLFLWSGQEEGGGRLSGRAGAVGRAPLG